ncbi:Rho GDP-dissociation inhibitor 1 [Hordeum vulgare]|nr:Rho GDP-dissociation inhibitor 1 [Hordeum vulgare]
MDHKEEEEASVSVSVPPEEQEQEEEEEEEGEEEDQEEQEMTVCETDWLTVPFRCYAAAMSFQRPSNQRWTILNLTILAPGRPHLLLPIPFLPDDKGHAFALKDGTAYSFRFSFAVSNNIVSGLKYSHTVWKTGVRVENQKVMLGTFSPQQEPYTYKAEEDSTPSGIFARGSYSARLKFVDDDGKVYLDMRYSFEIRKDWPALPN